MVERLASIDRRYKELCEIAKIREQRLLEADGVEQSITEKEKMQGTMVPGKDILKEGRKARQVRDVAQACADASGNVNDNADSICWFCHADVSNLENNKCAGCRKVTDPHRG